MRGRTREKLLQMVPVTNLLGLHPLVGQWLFLLEQAGNVIVMGSGLPSPMERGWDESFTPGVQMV